MVRINNTKVNSHRERIAETATIFQRGKKGTFWIRFRYNGSEEKFSLKTSSRKHARQKATKIASEVQEEVYKSKPESKSCADAAEEFLHFLHVKGRSRNTIRVYRSEIKRFTEYAKEDGRKWLHQIDISFLDKFHEHLLGSVDKYTVYQILRLVKQLFRWCNKRNLIRQNLLAEYELEKPRRNKRPAPTMGQVNTIIQAAEEPERTQLVFLALTGCRVSEMKHMLKSDVDLDNNWIKIVSREGAETKTRQSRKIAIHTVLREFLEALPPHKSRWLFTVKKSKGCPAGDRWLNTNSINADLKALLKSLKIPAGRKSGGFTTHSLRSFFKSHCINSGIQKQIVDEWQGHVSMSSASDRYYQLDDEENQRWIKKVPFIVNGHNFKPCLGDTDVFE